MKRAHVSWSKRCLALAAAACGLGVAGTSLAKVEVTQGNGVTTYQFSIEGIDFKKVDLWGDSYTQALLKGVAGYQGILYDEGKPMLPVLRFYVDGDGAVDFQTGGQTHYEELRNAQRIVPATPSVPKIPGARRRLAVSTETYGTNAFLPKEDHEITTVGSVRGIKRRLVTIYPMHYNPATGAWILTPEVTVTVKGQPPVQQMQAQGVQTLAVIIGEAYKDSPALARYLTEKERSGYSVQRIVVSQAEAQDADKTPDQIRGQLQALYQRTDAPPLAYALIIGDQQDVPAHKSDNMNGVTDQYYSAIDTNDYASDIGAPDIAVGRLSVSTLAELDTVLAKLERYDQANFAGQDWLHKIEWIASSDPTFWQVAEGSFNYAIDNYTRNAQFLGSFPDQPEVGGDKLYAVTYKADTPDVLARINEGRGFINYDGHGSADSWAGPELGSDAVKGITQTDALPVVVANACITGAFTTDSLAEAWLRAPHGAVMYWGSMDSTFWDEDDVLQRALYDNLFRNHELSFGRFTSNSLAAVWRYYGGAGKSKYYEETYVTFGDPTMSMRTQAAAAVTVVAKPDAASGQLSLVVQDVPSGKLIANARIALSETGPDGQVKPIAVRQSDDEGKAVIDLGALKDAHAIDVRVSGENLKPSVVRVNL